MLLGDEVDAQPVLAGGLRGDRPDAGDQRTAEQIRTLFRVPRSALPISASRCVTVDELVKVTTSISPAASMARTAGSGDAGTVR